MTSLFPDAITKLPLADVPLDGVQAFLSQSQNHQILFMEFDKDVNLPEHAHAAQVGFVLEGQIDMTMNGKTKTYTKGDRYYIPAGMKHSGKIYAGYCDITFFDEAGRYEVKISNSSG